MRRFVLALIPLAVFLFAGSARADWYVNSSGNRSWNHGRHKVYGESNFSTWRYSSYPSYSYYESYYRSSPGYSYYSYPSNYEGSSFGVRFSYPYRQYSRHRYH